MSDMLRLTLTAGTRGRPPCPRTAHDRTCPTPWGWDELHSDQLTPYTLDQLAARQEHPHRYAYPDKHAYLEGFHLWRALRREDTLTPAEGDAKLEALAWSLEFCPRCKANVRIDCSGGTSGHIRHWSSFCKRTGENGIALHFCCPDDCDRFPPDRRRPS